MPFIDAHVHVWTPDTAHYPLAAGFKRENMSPRSFTPDELLEDGKSIPATGSMFVGDKGVILNNEIIPSKKMQEYRTQKGLPQPQGEQRGGRGGFGAADAEWLAAFKGGPASQGNFLNAANCSEAIALAMRELTRVNVRGRP